jgi:hypothetical protein
LPQTRVAGGPPLGTYDPENVTRPKEQRARFLTETDCNHLRDIMWLRRARGNFGQADVSLGPDAAAKAQAS